jgi:hypothetical protein
MTDQDEDRRKFLATCGRFAAVTPPTITLLLSTTLTSNAIAGSQGHSGYGNGQGGYGYSNGQDGNSQGGNSQGGNNNNNNQGWIRRGSRDD